MKKNRMQISTLLTLLLCMLLLTACGASTTESEGTDPETPPQESAAAPETEEPSAQQEDVTLEELLGEDYVNYLTETITMQMANRMDKDPEVRYFPIEDNAPLLLCKQAAKIFQTICKKETALKRVLRNLLSAISFAQI